MSRLTDRLRGLAKTSASAGRRDSFNEAADRIDALETEREACWIVLRNFAWITHDDLPLAITQAHNNLDLTARQLATTLYAAAMNGLLVPTRPSDLTQQIDQALASAKALGIRVLHE